MRLSRCNLHGVNNESGISATIPQITIKQLILSIPITQQYNNMTDIWLQAGSMKLGPVHISAVFGLPYQRLRVIQDMFLKLHDRRTRRLNFLWPAPDSTTLKFHLAAVGKCGCAGGCSFFGNKSIGISLFKPHEQHFLHTLTARISHMMDGPVEVLGRHEDSISMPSSIRTLTQASSGDHRSVITLTGQEKEETSLTGLSNSISNTSTNIGPALQKYLQKARLSSWLHGSTLSAPQTTEGSLSSNEILRSKQTETIGSHQSTTESDLMTPKADKPMDSSMTEDSDKFISCAEIGTGRAVQKTGEIVIQQLSEDVSDDDSITSDDSFATATSKKLSVKHDNSESFSIHDCVNLHRQLNQPITTSPILISSYMKHLTQLICSHWTALAPVPHLISRTRRSFDDHFLSGSPSLHSSVSNLSNFGLPTRKSKLIPQFSVIRPGFSPGMMIPKSQPKSPANMKSSNNNIKRDHFSEDKSATKTTHNQQTKGLHIYLWNIVLYYVDDVLIINVVIIMV